MIFLLCRVGGRVRLEPVTTLSAERDAIGEFPDETTVSGGGPDVTPYPPTGALYSLLGDPAIRYGYGYPFSFGTYFLANPPLVAAYTVHGLGDGRGGSLLLAPVVGAGVRITHDDVSDGLGDGVPIGDHGEYFSDPDHLAFVDYVGSLVVVVPETIGCWAGAGNQSLQSLSDPPTAAPLCRLRPLELRQLIQDAFRELPFGRVVSPVVEGTETRAMLGELFFEDVNIGGLAGEPITILHQNEIYPMGRNQVSQFVETRSGEART